MSRRFYLHYNPSVSSTRDSNFLTRRNALYAGLGLGVFLVVFATFRYAIPQKPSLEITVEKPELIGESLSESSTLVVSKPNSSFDPKADFQKRISADPIKLQILNGCGIKGIGKVISPALRQKGFDVREVKNASHFHHGLTKIISRAADFTQAYIVADSLGIDRSRVSSELNSKMIDIDVSLVVGADYESLRLNLSSQN